MTVLHMAVLCLGIAGAFFFAGVETGFVSWNPLKIGYRAQQGSAVARWALYLIQHKERVISMLLIGNNACVVGATLSFLFLYSWLNQRLAFDMERIPSPETWFLTPVIVVFSEMLPKSLFRIYSFRLTMRSIPVLMILYWITFPATWLLSKAGTVFQRRVRHRSSFGTNVRKEMVLIAQEGTKRGTLFEYATIMVDTILNLKRIKLRDINTAYHDQDVSGEERKRIRITDTVADICQREYLTNNNDVLVYNADGETVVGLVTLLDIAKADGNTSIKAIMKSLPCIEEETSLLSFFSKKPDFYRSYYQIIDRKGKKNGILDNFSIFRIIFSG